MSHDLDHGGGGGGLLANKTLWLCVGIGIFLLVAFILPTPQSVVDTVDKYGFAEKMIKWELAEDAHGAAAKTMIVLGIIPMAVIFFATEAIPIGLTGILMPVLAYFFHLLPSEAIGKTFAGDAPMFLLGVLAMGVAVVDVGFHKRLASWLLGWTKGFYVPVFVLCISMAVVGSFISAHAMCAFMTPVMAAVYFGAVAANSPGGRIEHDPALAKFLLFTLCFALNVGRSGLPGGRRPKRHHDGVLERIQSAHGLLHLDEIRPASGPGPGRGGGRVHAGPVRAQNPHQGPDPRPGRHS